MSEDPRLKTKPAVIVAAVDDTPAADDVVRTAIATVRGFDAATLHFVFIAEPPLTDVLQLVRLSDQLAEGRAILERVARSAAEHLPGRIESHLAVDIAATGILQTAADLVADIIIVGTHGKRCLERLVLGSVTRAVVDRAHCTVIVARKADYPFAPVPAIEPACPLCLAVQRETADATLWCSAHERRSLSPHLHYRVAEPYAFDAVSAGARSSCATRT